jgi:hypothetical protein
MTITSQATRGSEPCLQQHQLLLQLSGRAFTTMLKLPGNAVTQTDDPSLYITTPSVSRSGSAVPPNRHFANPFCYKSHGVRNRVSKI